MHVNIASPFCLYSFSLEIILSQLSAFRYIWGIERSGFFNGREKWVKGFENQMV